MENGIIRLLDVSLSYDGQRKDAYVLKKINMNIEPQEFVCVLGPSGCGKTSLLNLIAGFVNPSEGKILFKGIPIEGIDRRRGVVFQEPNLYEWMNVRKNINFGLRMRKLPKDEIQKKTDEVLHEVGLEDSSEKYVYELSGGMKQRVGIARVLINDVDEALMLGTRVFILGGVPGGILLNERIEYYKKFEDDDSVSVKFSKEYGETRRKFLSYIGMD